MTKQKNMMNVIVNGDNKIVLVKITIRGLLDSLGIQKQRVAVAVNGSVISKSLHEEVSLSEGDKIEVVRMVGGG